MLGEVIPHAGCQALYHLESDGSDSSGNGRDLSTSIYGAFSTGKLGNGLASNNDDHLDYSDSVGVDLRTKIFGLSFWFKITTQPASGTGYEFVLWMYKSGLYMTTYKSTRVTYCRPSGEGYKIQLEWNSYPTGTLADFTAALGRWYKCDVTADGTNAYLYINGTKYIEMASGTEVSYTSQGIELFGDDSEAVQGMMDEVAFLDYHRTEQDIARQYAFEMGLL